MTADQIDDGCGYRPGGELGRRCRFDTQRRPRDSGGSGQLLDAPGLDVGVVDLEVLEGGATHQSNGPVQQRCAFRCASLLVTCRGQKRLERRDVDADDIAAEAIAARNGLDGARRRAQ